MFTIKTNLQSFLDEEGKRYIINPITKERIYEFVPELIENTGESVLPNLEPVSGLFPKIDNI